jgi:hypothetical protein
MIFFSFIQVLYSKLSLRFNQFLSSSFFVKIQFNFLSSVFVVKLIIKPIQASTSSNLFSSYTSKKNKNLSKIINFELNECAQHYSNASSPIYFL